MAEFEFVRRLRLRFVELGKLTPIALIATFLPMLGTSILFAFGYPLGLWLKENPGIGVIGFFAGVLIFCGLALVPTNVIGIIGGFAFGFDLGLAILLTAIVGASFLSFLIHRRIIGDKVPDIAARHPKGQAIYEALVGQGFLRTTTIVLLVRLSIMMPFALTNFILASAKVPIPTFLIGTLLGMLPRSAAVVLAGAGLSELSLDLPLNSWVVVFGIAATLFSMIVISVISKRALDKLTRTNAG